MPVRTQLWQARYGLDARYDDAAHGPALLGRWGVSGGQTAAYEALCAALDDRIGHDTAWRRALEGLLTGRIETTAALPDAIAADWRAHGVLGEEGGRLHIAWEALAGVAPHIDFTPPLLSVLLGRFDAPGLDRKADALGLAGGGPYTRRAQVFRALGTRHTVEDDLVSSAGRDLSEGMGVLFGLIDRAGEPVASAPDHAPIAGHLFGYPDPASDPLCLPLEVADAIAHHRLAALDTALDVEREAVPITSRGPSSQLIPTGPLRAAALQLMSGVRIAGPLGFDADGALDLARATLRAATDPPLIDRDPWAIVDHHLTQSLGPLDPTRDTLTALIGVDRLTATLAGGRGLVAGPARDRRALDAIGRDTQRLISRAQWAVLDRLSRWPSSAAPMAALARTVILAAVRGVAGSHRERWSLAARLPTELVPPSAGALLSSASPDAARAHLDALIDRLLGPLGLARREGPAVWLAGPTLAASLARIREGAGPDDRSLPRPTFVAESDGGLQIELPISTRLGALSGLDRLSPLIWRDGRGWHVRLSASIAAESANRALLVELGAGTSAIAGWFRRTHGGPDVSIASEFTPIEAATAAELDWYLAERALPAHAVRRVSPRVALVNTSLSRAAAGSDPPQSR